MKHFQMTSEYTFGIRLTSSCLCNVFEEKSVHVMNQVIVVAMYNITFRNRKTS